MCYFDNYYNFYGYNSWYNPYDVWLGFNVGFGYNPWYSRYDRYGYGYPHYTNLWGPYSYYPWYNSGYYGNGYYGNGYYGNGYYGNNGGNNWGNNVIVGRDNNYRPRPTRGADGSGNAGGRYDGTVPSRGNVNVSGRPTRPEGYNPTTNGTITRPTTTGSSNRPSATPSTGSRPIRESQTPAASRPTYTPPPTQQSSPPPSNTGSSSSGQSGSSSGDTRPTRGGGRG